MSIKLGKEENEMVGVSNGDYIDRIITVDWLLIKIKWFVLNFML